MRRRLEQRQRTRRTSDGSRSGGSPAGPGQETGQRNLTVLRPGTTEQSSRVVVQLHTGASHQAGADVSDLVRAACAPGVTVVIADMAPVAACDAAVLQGLLTAHRNLVARGGELRIVVWSQELYAALQMTGISTEISVFASIDSALKAL
jgi:anti-anti-sigma regulatory factor